MSVTEDVPGVLPKIGMTAIKGVSILYDVVSTPIAIPFHKPWKAWKSKKTVFAKSKKEPSGPFERCVDKLDRTLFDGIHTIDDILRQSVEKFPNHRAFGTREVFGETEEVQPDGKVFKKLNLGDYKWVTYKEFEAECELISKAFLSIGLRPRQNVCILADTRYEWALAAQACFRTNIPLVTLYANLGEEAIVHGMNETEVTHLITTQELLPTIIKLLPRIPSLTHVVYMEILHKKEALNVPETNVKLIPFSRLKSIGQEADPELKGEKPGPDDAAILMYTSGSTGVPKGVVILQKNIVATAKAFQTAMHPFSKVKEGGSYLAYLPLAHIFELEAEAACMMKGMRIGFSSPLTLTNKSTAIMNGQVGDAMLVKPNLFCAVPLVLDRIRKIVIDTARTRGPFFKMLLDFAIEYKTNWLNLGFDTPIFNALIFKKTKELLGGDLRVLACGSAPLAMDTQNFLKCIFGCSIVQGYGLTETACGGCLTENEDMSTARVGPPLSGALVKLIDWPEANYYITDKPYPRGEIVIGGETVTQGYYKNEALTNECYFNEDGVRWFRTGDIGEVYPDGTFKIIDRKKDIVKLQFGEYISLGKIETELKTCNIVDNLCVYGNSYHNYVIALIAPNEKALNELAMKLGKSDKDITELCNDKDVIEDVQKIIRQYSLQCGLHKMEIPTKIKLCPEPWLPDSGLVSAAMKIRRKQLTDFYREDIDRLYQTGTRTN